MNLLNKDTNVVTDYLTKNFVDLTNRAFAPYGVAELRLYHAEGRLHVRPAMIMAHEHVSTQHEIMVHLRPHRAVGMCNWLVAVLGEVGAPLQWCVVGGTAM